MTGIPWNATVSGRVSARLEQMLVGELNSPAGATPPPDLTSPTQPERLTPMVAFPDAALVHFGRGVA